MQVSWFVNTPRRLPWQKCYNYNRVMASTWIRCLQLIPYLDTLGISSKINSWDDHTQIAIFLRKWNSEELEVAKKLKQKNIKVILDTPVNFFSEQNIPPFQGGILDQFLSFADISDLILCPSPFTEEFGRKKGYNTLCIEDSIDFRHFKYQKKEYGKNLIWSGVSVKADVLNFLAPTVNKNKWNVIIISDKKPALDFNFKYVKWNYYSFPKDIFRGDISIFPRVIDNEYNMGHSFFKIGVFIAQNVPVICSLIPSYKQVLTPLNGISLNDLNPTLWEYHINSILSGEVSFSFQDVTMDKYSTLNISERYKILFNELINS